ncbi:hypothetical protein QOZ80_5BG0449780 [Eleusine coracana subsp. coracana]|nr:hypothetical protein QOZ80_5BG0449780 [Eleusine coracana subsp. coracana]
MAPHSSSSALSNVTVEDADALDCGVCFLPLKAPIFQCEVGHVLCAPCRHKLQAGAGGGCHVCGAASGFRRRCHAMERLVGTVLVPCPNAAHGCDSKPAYHDRREAHARACQHAPCRCPDEACRFVGSTDELMLHFAAVHGWPCSTKACFGEVVVSFTVELRDGFTFVRADDTGSGKSRCHLFLLNMARGEVGCAINVV